MIMLESLVLLLSYFDIVVCFGNLCGVVVDEWYELIVSKCGMLL